MKDNEALAKEKWDKLFSRDQENDQEGEILLILPPIKNVSVRQIRVQPRRITRQRKGWLHRERRQHA